MLVRDDVHRKQGKRTYSEILQRAIFPLVDFMGHGTKIHRAFNDISVSWYIL